MQFKKCEAKFIMLVEREIKNMLRLGMKLELEALSAKGISFVTKTYLPEKIRKKQYLD